MALPNNDPIFSKVGDSSIGPVVTAANTAMDGTGTVNLIYTADATNGGFVSIIELRALGSCVASVARIFLNNGSTPTSAANNSLIRDVTLPATTASNTTALVPIDIPINKALAPGYRLYMTLGTAVSAGWIATTWGGKY